MSIHRKSKGLHIGLWILQGLLAVAFGLAGFMKTTTPIDQLAEIGLPYLHTLGAGMVRFIGIVEVLGALGLILPAALRIKPYLTPAAAIGIAIVMILAGGFHITRGEPFIFNLVLLLMAVFVAWGRFKKVPIHSR